MAAGSFTEWSLTEYSVTERSSTRDNKRKWSVAIGLDRVVSSPACERMYGKRQHCVYATSADLLLRVRSEKAAGDGCYFASLRTTATPVIRGFSSVPHDFHRNKGTTANETVTRATIIIMV